MLYDGKTGEEMARIASQGTASPNAFASTPLNQVNGNCGYSYLYLYNYPVSTPGYYAYRYSSGFHITTGVAIDYSWNDSVSAFWPSGNDVNNFTFGGGLTFERIDRVSL